MRMSRRIRTKDIALIGVMVATLEAVKLALTFLPGVELVTLLIVIYTLVFGWRVFYAIAAFVLIEGCLYGFGIWWIMYLYIWPLLALLAHLFRKAGGELVLGSAYRSLRAFFRGAVRVALSGDRRLACRAGVVGGGNPA